MFRCILFSSVLCLFLSSCRETNTQNGKAVKEEMRQREVIHLTDAQISERAFELGDTLITKAESRFFEILRNTNDQSCVPSFEKVSSEMKLRYECLVFRVPFESQSKKEILTKKEKEIMDAYLFNRAHHLPVSSNYQKEGDKNFFFTKALVINDKKCFNCHQEMQNPLIKGGIGDTIGVWFVRFSKKKVVMSFIE